MCIYVYIFVILGLLLAILIINDKIRQVWFIIIGLLLAILIINDKIRLLVYCWPLFIINDKYDLLLVLLTIFNH